MEYRLLFFCFFVFWRGGGGSLFLYTTADPPLADLGMARQLHTFSPGYTFRTGIITPT